MSHRFTVLAQRMGSHFPPGEGLSGTTYLCPFRWGHLYPEMLPLAMTAVGHYHPQEGTYPSPLFPQEQILGPQGWGQKGERIAFIGWHGLTSCMSCSTPFALGGSERLEKGEKGSSMEVEPIAMGGAHGLCFRHPPN